LLPPLSHISWLVAISSSRWPFLCDFYQYLLGWIIYGVSWYWSWVLSSNHNKHLRGVMGLEIFFGRNYGDQKTSFSELAVGQMAWNIRIDESSIVWKFYYQLTSNSNFKWLCSYDIVLTIKNKSYNHVIRITWQCHMTHMWLVASIWHVNT